MIAQAVDLLVFAAIGALIGALYFGRLRLSMRKLPRLHHPMLWMLAGTLARLVSQGQWPRLLAGLAGLAAAGVWLRRKPRRSA